MPEALIVGIVRAGLDEDTREGNPAGAARTPDLTPTPVKQIDVSYRLSTNATFILERRRLFCGSCAKS